MAFGQRPTGMRAGSATAALAHGTNENTTKAFDPTTAEETTFGKAGDPKKVMRTIKLDMSDAMRFTPADIVLKRGETVKLLASNKGRLLHEMVLRTSEELRKHTELMKKFQEMEHEEAHMIDVKPGQSGEIVWQFTQRGEFQFACLLPGHFEAGMVGKVVVK